MNKIHPEFIHLEECSPMGLRQDDAGSVPIAVLDRLFAGHASNRADCALAEASLRLL